MQLLPRPHARKQLQNAIAQRPITLLCGGAGIGKSVLLEEFFTINGFVDETSSLFIRFTKRDSSIKAFLRRFAIVLNLNELPDLNRPEQMAAAIEALPQGVILVLDDLHELGPLPEYTHYITQLIELTLHQAHHPLRRWVVALRRPTELPARISAAQKQVIILPAAQMLALGDIERDTLYDVRDVQTRPRIFGSMRTVMLNLGFLVADQRGLLGPRHQQPLAPTHGHRHKIAHRHVEQLIHRLKRELQKFLYTTCLLDEIDLGDLLETNDLSPLALQGLGDIGLLHYDAVLGGLRYDDTVSEYLQDTLKYCPIGIIDLATRHAAHAGIRRADVTHGLHILHEHQAWSHSLAILEKYGLHLLDHEPVHGAIAATIQSFPIDIIKNSPVAAGLYAALTARVSFGDVAESWFQNALQFSNITHQYRRQIAFRYALEIIRRERVDALDLISPLYEELEADPNLDPELRALVRIAMAVVSVQQKKPDDTLSYLNLALEADTLAYEDATHARVYHGAAYVRLRLGMPELALPLADRAITYAVRDGFYGLAAWCVSIRQELALNIQHDPLLALRYLRQLEFYAWLSEDARMLLTATMGIYWIGIEIADLNLMTGAHNMINRHDAVDDYMQMQVRLSLIPGASYLQAWKGQFEEAAKLSALYAPLAPPGHHQAFRWSELALYYAASHALRPCLDLRNKSYHALNQARLQLQKLEYVIEHENDVIIRLVIATLVLGKYRLSALLIAMIQNSVFLDKRAYGIVEALKIFMKYWTTDGEPQPMVAALRKLKEQQLGNIAGVIAALPLPPSTRRWSPSIASNSSYTRSV